MKTRYGVQVLWFVGLVLLAGNGLCAGACQGPQTGSERATERGGSQDATAAVEPTPESTAADVSTPQPESSSPDEAVGAEKNTTPEPSPEPTVTPEKTAPEPSSPDQPTTSNAPVIGGCQIFPADNPWNTDISKAPVDPNSAPLIASIGADTTLHPDFGTMWQGAPNGIPYVVVPSSQSRVKVSFQYADESDPGPYPIPKDAPIEGGPNGTGDRHVLVLVRQECKLYELFNAFIQPDGSWKAGSGAIFDLSSNKRRPDTWTSADAAGLPVMPGLIKHEEVKQGIIRHALRFTVVRSRKAFVHPATHWASSRTDANLPPMGMRVRLKASFSLAGYPKSVQVILQAMKTYGMFVADNGSNWYISGAPSQEWDDDELRALKRVRGRDFEVVKMGRIYTPADFP